MNKKLDMVFDSLVGAGLVAVILGICITAGDYLALTTGEKVLESWAWMPAGWGETHQATLGALAFAIALVPAGIVFWWIFRGGMEEHG